MDCMEAMRQMPDKYFELAVVDPPYGIGMDGGQIWKSFYKKRIGITGHRAIIFANLCALQKIK